MKLGPYSACNLTCLNCTFDGNHQCELLIEGGGNNTFQDCNLEASYNTTECNLKVYGAATNLAFKRCHFERWVGGTGSHVILSGSPRGVIFEGCNFQGEPLKYDVEVINALYTKFEQCYHYHAAGAGKKCYPFCNDAKVTRLIRPLIYESGSADPLTDDEFLGRKIVDESSSTIIDLSGHALIRPDNIAGLSDGAISSAGFCAFPIANLACATKVFNNEDVWTPEGVTITEETMLDVVIYKMTSAAGTSHLLSQTIANIADSEHLFAVMMASSGASSTVKLGAIYNIEGAEEVTREFVVDSRARWYQLILPHKPTGATQIEIHIYADISTPIYLADSMVVAGTIFPGAITNPHPTQQLVRPLGALMTPRMATFEGVFGNRDGSGFIHIGVLGEDDETPPELAIAPTVGDIWFDPKLLSEGYVGYIYVSALVGWKKFGALES